MTSQKKTRAGAEARACSECEGKGYRFRLPDGFNPFSAGGWNTINAMYRVPCGCAALKTQGEEA